MRKATIGDLGWMAEIGAKVHVRAQLPFPYKPEDAKKSMRGMIEDGCALVHGMGFIAGVLSPSWPNKDWVMAVCLTWVSEDGGGQVLKSGFEDWANEMGADEVLFSPLSAIPTVARFFERSGYTHKETVYGRMI